MRPDGTDDRFKRSFFEASNRITFPSDLSDLDRDWWLRDVYLPHRLTPEEVGDRLSASWAGDRRMEVIELDGRSKTFTINIVGERGLGTIWILNRTIEFNGSFLNANQMFVDEASQGAGLGRKFMEDAVNLASELGLSEIRIEADLIGRYAWLRCGFVPERGSWHEMQRFILHKLVQVSQHLEPSRFSELIGIVKSGRPEVARELAMLVDPVPSGQLFQPNAEPAIVPLGKVLFLEGCPIWVGSFDLGDETSMSILKQYLEEVG